MVANIVAWVVLLFVPIVVIVVFWLMDVLPEKIAQKRHHSQCHAIQTLCLLSLLFGGLLWPIAWLWAYTKPVGYKMAYGTEKHEEYYDETHEKLGPANWCARKRVTCGKNSRRWSQGRAAAEARRA